MWPSGWSYTDLIGPDLLFAVALVGIAVAYVTGVFFSEVLAPVRQWVGRRTGLADAGQSAAVHAYAVRLASRSRATRLKAVRRLGDLNDRTAVPALMKAARRYDADGPLLEAVVRALSKLGDVRALPLLRELSQGRHMTLMQEARAAVSAIEPRTILLRPSSGSEDVSDRLVRAIEPSTAEQLLRPTGDT